MKVRWCALALLLAAGNAAGAELSRLFFTPAQRAALDSARKQSVRGELPVITQKPAAPAPPQNVSVSGLVRRSDGKSTVWLNDRPISEQNAAGINATPGKTDDRVRLTVPGTDRSVDLKVGQTVEILSGTIEEGYARRTVPPKPIPNPPPAAQTKPPAEEKAAAPPAPASSPVAKPDASTPIRSDRARSREIQEEANK
jgi:hypothetical protein